MLGNDGDEYGVGADIESVLAAADRVNWRTCVTHGDENPHVWGCPECLRELREENRRLRAAMEKHCATLVMLPEQDDRVDRERVVKETLRFKDEFLTPNA
ncbi:MAG TPA: hypothetical protein VFL54_09085 [Gammaproteobacteria bacterium]|nr:hypothetical protein [Gammaproteobacteria bacterium]